MQGNEDLLQPTLTAGSSSATAIYSAQTGFYSSFFGGPFAAILIAAVNSRRLGRLREDAPVYLAAVVLFIAAVWLLADGAVRAWLTENLGNRGSQLALRVLALAFFGAFYLRHRRHYRNMEIMGIEPPNGWPVGLASVVAGAAVSFGLALLITTDLGR